MSLVVAETGSAVDGARSARRPAALALLEQNGTLVLLLSVVAFDFLYRLPSSLASDSWGLLLSGREIVAHGLPSHDTITVWAHGRRWVDEQWLAQITMYGLQRLGGFRLLALANATLAVGGFGAACAVARRRGASALSVTWVGAAALFAFYSEASVIRAQSLAYALFVAVLALLVGDLTKRSRRVFLVLPLLVLWANLHGSVVVGAVLVSLYGIFSIVASRTDPATSRTQAAMLTVAPWACIFASPYALSLPSYYRWVLLDAHFERYVTEWVPTTLSLVTLPVFALAALGAWLFGRAKGSVHAFPAVAFFGTALLALHAERNLPWFGLTAILVLPGLLDRARTPPREPRRANRLLVPAVLGVVAVTAVVVATKSETWFLRDYPRAAANAAAAAAGPRGRIFANESYADWLVWEHPELSGRIAFDWRFELLTTPQLNSILAFRVGLVGWQAAARGYDVLVLSARHEQPAIQRLLRARTVRRVATFGGIVVLRRNSARSHG